MHDDRYLFDDLPRRITTQGRPFTGSDRWVIHGLLWVVGAVGVATAALGYMEYAKSHNGVPPPTHQHAPAQQTSSNVPTPTAEATSPRPASATSPTSVPQHIATAVSSPPTATPATLPTWHSTPPFPGITFATPPQR